MTKLTKAQEIKLIEAFKREDRALFNVARGTVEALRNAKLVEAGEQNEFGAFKWVLTPIGRLRAKSLI